eukprot:8496148-Heterocapsa_arctica.AAC.1
MKSTLISDHRLIGASIGWGRKKTMHVICINGLDTGQTNPRPEEGNNVLRSRISERLAKIGRVPWVIGGDWNVEPGTFTLGNTNAKAAYVDPGSRTFSRDGVHSKLNRFLVCAELAISAEAMVNNDTHIS